MKNLGLYIHIPFCKCKCHYCDFVSFPGMDAMFDEYIDALISEMQLYSDYLQDRIVDTVFIGGGTPSLLPPYLIQKLMDGIKTGCHLAPEEVTIEANPESLNDEKIRIYAQCGINRLSIGMQSHDDTVLNQIGRIHTYEMFRSVYSTAKCCISNINIDTMFALPKQTLSGFEDTMRCVIALEPSHVSSYALKLEPGTPLAQTYTGAGEDLDRSMYHSAVAMLMDAGYVHYETSNFAKPGAECRHNLKYWTGGKYLGLGAAAHSFTADGVKRRHSNTESISEYLLAITDGQKPISESARLSLSDEKTEYIMLRLRLASGFNMAEYNDLFGSDFERDFSETIKLLQRAGLLNIKNDNIIPTLKGFDLQNTLIAEFIKKI